MSARCSAPILDLKAVEALVLTVPQSLLAADQVADRLEFAAMHFGRNWPGTAAPIVRLRVRYEGYSCRETLWLARQLMTRSDTSRPPIAALRKNYSALMPAALIIGHHFSMSAFCNARSAPGVCWSRGGTSYPRSVSF
jgi:hypothetical protein